MSNKTWPTVARYVSSRTAGVRYEVRQRPDLASAPTLADVYCTCPSWRFSKRLPKQCNHTDRWLTRDQYDGAPPPVSQTRHLLTQADALRHFTEHQLRVLEAALESRLVRGRAVSPGASARTAPRLGGVREIVFDE